MFDRLWRRAGGCRIPAVRSSLDVEHTFDSRAIRPYPPGNVRVNGQYYPEHLNGELLSLEWSHRDRTQQTGEVIIDTLESDIGPEAGTTYTVRIEDDFGGLILEESGIAGTTWDEDSSSMIEDASFVIKLYSERDIASSSDPYQSWQQHVIPMLRNAPVDSSSDIGASSDAGLCWDWTGETAYTRPEHDEVEFSWVLADEYTRNCP